LIGPRETPPEAGAGNGSRLFDIANEVTDPEGQHHGDYQMATFIGKVSVFVKNNELVLVKDAAGAWDKTNVPQLLAKLKALSKEHKMPINQWALWAPEVPAGTKTTPVLLARKRFGAPYIAILEVKDEAATTKKAKPTKLA